MLRNRTDRACQDMLYWKVQQVGAFDEGLKTFKRERFLNTRMLYLPKPMCTCRSVEESGNVFSAIDPTAGRLPGNQSPQQPYPPQQHIPNMGN